MSKLSYLDKLLDGVVVEWKTLGEVAKYIRGLTYSKSNESADGQGYRVLRANNITLSSNCLNLNDVKLVKFDTKVKDSQKLYKDDILISAASGSREHVGKVAYIESDIDYYFGGFMGVVRCDEKLNPRYLFHVLTSDIFQKYLDEMLNSSTINNLNSAVMGGFKIPIPCPNKPDKSLAIQSEIVRILDKFTALTAELTAELTMRKKQYNYYRDQLLSFDEEQEKPIYLEKLLDGVEVEWLPLSDLARIRNGKDHKSLSEGEFPVYGSGGIMRYVDTYAYNKPSVLIPRKGSLGNLFFIDVPFWTVDTIFYTEIDEAQIRPKYLYYFLTTVGLGEMNQAGGVPSQTQSVLNKLKIPIPCPDNPEKSLAIQSEIVRILDKFDTLTNSITEGLPREIELRQKQYEYYRDLLFSFPKPETVSN
ncbi:restriction endonuclease subunit S [Cronobacter malonaticus]|uniref:restriction endonuclease subunit S n=1 Tax=Cronobacter malonaticus TaxID=413503 RepID=UPI0029E6E236|nr:restriction endonuclease subunit S [Cronobacter sakazakii]